MRAPRALAVLVAVALLVSCGGDDTETDSEGSTPATASTQELDGTLTVLAATSLQGAFADIEAAFEDAHPDVDVQVSTDGSANLATAIIEGGVPADVFASADEQNLERVVDAGLAEEGAAEAFVANRLQIVVEEGNPLGIESLEDLTDPDVSVSLCQPDVPCGRYAEAAFAAAGLAVPPAGEEDKVSGVVRKVALGEADAGIVYVTDVLAADDDVDGVDLADDEQVTATYPASVLSDAPNPTAARAFVAYLSGADAQEIFERYGFEVP
ncbi:MAG: molybdate ABC transporter substrate-binding protein [Acidimicrobiales bacterium]